MDPASNSTPRKLRRGARSCVACRKRKLRCAWTSKAAQSCRRCEERQLECVPQTTSTPSSSQRPKTTRDRISSLEQQVEALTKALQSRESAPAGDGVPASVLQSPASGEESDDLDGTDVDPSVPNATIPADPSYLSALFNNSLLIAAKRDENDEAHAAPPSQLCDVVRSKLQPLIPSKEDLVPIANRASGWLYLMNDIFPIVTTVRSGTEMWSRYEEVNQPTADPWMLASWLLTIALTVEHNPGIQLRTRSAPNLPKGGSEYSRSVASAVYRTVICCDELMASIKGIELSVLLVRLHLSFGNFSKGFLLLRRAVAASELIGLPRMDDGPNAALWRSICVAERFQSMVFAFPSATRYYWSHTPDAVFDGGNFIPTNFFFRLSGITVTIGGPGGTQNNRASLEELEDTCLRLGDELHQLAAEMPSAWWLSTPDRPIPDQLMQYFYHYVTMRIHLPLVLRRDASIQSSQSRLACSKACQSVLESYLGLCPVLPKGYFIYRIMNIQVFTAAVVLVLTEYSAFVPEGQQRAGSCPSPASMDLISRLTQAMENTLERAGSSHARETLFGIRALTQLLSQRDIGHDRENIMLRVPLLGKLDVRRNESPRDKCHSGQLILPEPTQGAAYNTPPDSLLNDIAPASLCWSIEDAYQMLFYETADLSDATTLGFL